MLEQHPEHFWTELNHQKPQAIESSRVRRCKQRYAETPGTDCKKNTPGDLQPQLEQRTSAWGLANSTSCPSFKERKGQDQPQQLSSNQLIQLLWRLMERVITRRLTWFLETNNIFSPSQTGYRQHRSTEGQLVLLTQDIENSFQEKRKLLAVFFNLSKAFNRVWKKGLQWKLLRAGVSGQMYRWISSFLYHRMARVELDGSLSREIRLKEGVPRGSVLSPTLFLLYVNYIVNTLPPRVTNSLHDDDLAASTSAEHISTATHVMQETINRVSS